MVSKQPSLAVMARPRRRRAASAVPQHKCGWSDLGAVVLPRDKTTAAGNRALPAPDEQLVGLYRSYVYCTGMAAHAPLGVGPDSSLGGIPGPYRLLLEMCP
jgi:hypothetical protein